MKPEDALFLSLEMPGVSPDAVNIMLDQRVLTISGRSRSSAPEGYSLTHQEYRNGDYGRVFTLSEAIDSDKIEPELKGVSPEVTEIAARAGEDDQRQGGGMRGDVPADVEIGGQALLTLSQ